MENELMLKKSLTINAPADKVWDALTRPELIKQYFFGTEAVTDWKKGSPIFFRGVWNGTAYEDKGTILNVNPGRSVRYNYWSSMSGTEDIPENYANISYEVSPTEDDATVLTVTQDGFDTPEKREHSESSWDQVLEGLKKLVEQ